MQKIKSVARREAWYRGEGDQVKTYNFFGRPAPRRRQRDEENLGQPELTHVTSASPIEDRRREDQNFPSSLHPPNKSNTFGGSPSVERLDSTGETSDLSSAAKTDASVDEKKNIHDAKPAPPPLEINGSPLNAPTNTESTGPRKRHFHLPFGKKNKDKKEKGGANDGEETGLEDLNVQNKQKRPQEKITVASQIRAVLFSWINLLLVFVPVGIALEYSGVNKVVVFCMNFVAIIPLAAILSYSTEELALYIGEVLGGLLNATFGNAVELIVSIIALTQHKTLIVQTSLIGSMLSNLLLVMGMCFFFGGLGRQEQFFNITVAQTAASLLALAIGSLIIPTAFQIFTTNKEAGNGITPLSRGTCVLLLLVYGCYLIFQLRTHVEIYNETGGKASKKSDKKEAGDASKSIAMATATGAAFTGGQVNSENLVRKDEEEEKQQPQLTRVGALVTLAISTTFIALCAEYMVTAIDVVGKDISQEFIGLILLPIVGNAAEHATAVTVAIKDKMDLAIGVAIGSSLQIALLVLPLMVMLNWWSVGSPSDLNLNFDGFLVSVLFISIILVNYLIQDGKSHWLEGVMLQIAYLIIAIAAYFYPANGDVAG